MEASELRVGNLFLDSEDEPHSLKYLSIEEEENDFCLVWGTETSGEYSWIEDCKGVPITEEWLIKFWFRLSDSNKHVYEIEAFGTVFTVLKYLPNNVVNEEFRHLNYEDFIIDIPSYYDECRFHNFKYVHQLQNLYFALTQTELQWKT